MSRRQESEAPTLAVVAPTVRGGPDLVACLDSLAAERYPRLEVIVVDNGCSPPVADRLPEDLGLRTIRNEENVGFAAAANQGIEASRSELVLLLNDDTVVEPGSLWRLVDALVSRPAWGACQAKLVLMDDPSLLDTAGSFLTSTGFLVHRGAYEPVDAFAAADEIFAAKGAALLVRRRVLDEVGSFDSDFFAYLEDTDLCWRIWLSGREVGFAADARIRHRERSTASQLVPAFVQFHSFKNRLCMLLTNLGPARLAWMLPYHVALCLGVALWFSLRGRGDIGGAISRALLWNVRRLPRTMRRRSRVQRLRRVDDRELMPRISRRASFRVLFGYASWTAERDAP